MRIMLRLVLLLAILSLTSCISMIHRSVDRDDLSGVRNEVEAGVPVESTDYRDKTPLLMAAEQGRMDIVRYLVEEAEADVNATTPESRGEITPLRYAITNEDYEMVRYLVRNGADVNQANRAGWTPIMTAARTGNREILGFLLDEGADLHARTEDGTTPVRVASNHGWTDIVVWMTMLLEEGES
ncbi:MAG: ankyrin repeat domain-containing protein [Alkalispirochaeta sp.]